MNKELKVKGLIFDLDGVIVFTDRLHYQAWKRIAGKKEIYFDETVNHRLRGVSRMESLEIILENYRGVPLTHEEKAELAEEKNEYYRELLCKMRPCDVTQEVRETLFRLRQKGYKLAIGSSSKNAKLIIEKTDLTGMFDAISDGTNITRSKPDPEVFIKAAKLLHLREEECAVVEDARVGIDAAKTANMTAIAYGEAAYYEKADMVLSSFSKILELI